MAFWRWKSASDASLVVFCSSSCRLVSCTAGWLSTADDLYQAAVNLHSRLTYEMEQQAELVELVEAARAAGALNFNVTDGQRRTLERLARVTGALATSLLRLDDMIALFHEY
jgi:hypothetical protein